MRLFCVLPYLAVMAVTAACQRQAPATAAAPVKCPPPPASMSTSADAPLNTTGLLTRSLDIPVSNMSVRISQPDLGQVIPSADASRYEARFVVSASKTDPLLVGRPDSEALVVAVALDAGRPRRVALGRAAITLSELLRVDEQLTDGEHWLFAAPLVASGVPEPRKGSPRSAVARRFFVGTVPSDHVQASGAVWLLAPEGTYNELSAGNVVFDAFAFNATGMPLATEPTLALSGPGVSGELRLASPFT
ncbi:MAG TPA: hypothetical protein VHW01_30780, partial [Polyangiaceae bacterium]|nr:hypothetical protein [Polyangiaceae bacterium]